MRDLRRCAPGRRRARASAPTVQGGEAGVWARTSMYGYRDTGIVRTTFVIDATGIIAHVFPIARVFPTVKPKNHAGVVRAALARG